MEPKKIMPMIIMAVIALISLFFVFQGVTMQGKVSGEEAKFHALQQSYWSIDKATRDAASTNSELNNQLVQIKNYPSSLLELKLVGIGNILAGIFALLLGILIALMMMPIKMAKIIGKMQ